MSQSSKGGNHDHWDDFAPQVRTILAESHIHELRNQVGTMPLYTIRGLGVLPSNRFRFNARPEIMVFTLIFSPDRPTPTTAQRSPS